jgi:hypothetical protein
MHVWLCLYRIKPKSVQMMFKAEKNDELKKNEPDLDADEVRSRLT